MNIGLLGAIGVEDIGDVVMLQSTIELLRKNNNINKNNLKLTMFALNKDIAREQMDDNELETDIVDAITIDDLPNEIIENINFCKLVKENILEHIGKKEYLNKILDCDALFFIGGGYFNKYWGDKLIPSFIIPIAIGYKLNKPIYISGVNIGPFDSEHIDKFYGVFEKVNTIIIRDRNTSLDTLKKLGGTRGDIIFGGDDILSRWYKDIDNIRCDEICAEGKKYAVVQLHHWVEMYSDNYIKFYKALAKFLENLLDNKSIERVFFLPFSLFKGVDYECGRRLGTFIENRKEYIVFEPTKDYIFMRQLISGAEFLIGSRYHPVVFGIGEQVPTIGIYVNDLYKQKISGAFQAVEIDHNSNMIYVNDLTFEKLVKWYEDTKAKNYMNSDKIKEIMDKHNLNRRLSIEDFIYNLDVK
ncbi:MULTISPECIES: polysaccharide pyruvyl transferase family protein [unclassified Sedimentibacter]|uniref:polysaccharide pyruvyl transferase family protein n=1 Tax=unclassified Sedimentibacter TaxID=2649220 RepID=UPI0027E08618|nr:polysaccharide pyruvyl transferase family protein [Sedimentibacter sp. MB35-C1]WMJ78647.1 polysaccharide pyruvyl transferase family protein [Sedimentibacter sp. MB35-C1]